MKPFIITALDIGTSFVKSLIAQIKPDGCLEVKGVGVSVSEGIDKGLVKDIQAVAASIRSSLSAAEKVSGCKAENIYLNITGEHIRSHNAMGRISVAGPLSNEPAEITQEHIAHVVNDARNSFKIQKGFERMQILHSFPQFFDIDDQKEIYNPINMNGFHLTSHVLLILADITAIRNLLRCIEVAGYEVESSNIVLSHIAAGMAVLSEDEKKLGVAMIDIGGGCCNIAFYNKGNLIQTYVTPMAGYNITRDLAIGLRTTIGNAEELKLEYGNADSDSVESGAELAVEGISGRIAVKYKQSHLSMIIQSRLNEFMETCYKYIKNAYPPELITAGIIITGGTANMRNIDSYLAKLYNLPVKTGYPDLSKLSGPISCLEDPSYATAVGMLFYALEQHKDLHRSLLPRFKLPGEGYLQKLIQYLKQYIT